MVLRHLVGFLIEHGVVGFARLQPRDARVLLRRFFLQKIFVRKCKNKIVSTHT